MKFWSEKLWIGLEEWSQLKNEELGIFKVEQLGEMKYVGIPKAQVILPWHKLAILPDLLWRCHLNPKDSSDLAKVRERLLDAPATHQYLPNLLDEFKNMSSPNKEGLEKLVNSLINKHKTNFKGVGQPLRIALVGSRFGPGIYNIILSLTKDEVVKRISKIN